MEGRIMLTNAIRNFRRGVAAVAAAAVLSLASGMPAHAQDTTTWRAIANQRTGGQWEGKWLWLQDELPKRTDGALKIGEISVLSELGLTGQELVRVLHAGLADIADVVTGYVSGDVPLIEGVQLPGIYGSYEQAEKGYAAWMKDVVVPHAQVLGGQPIASFAFADLYLWTKFPVNTLDDLKGKKIRVFASAQSDYLNALGAEPVSIPFSEVYTALERGTVDGVVTGPDAAEGLKLWEVVDYVSDLHLGIGGGFVVVAQRSWDALSEDTQQELTALGKELTTRAWDIGASDTEAGLKAAMDNGITATIPAKPEWEDAMQRAAAEVVAPNWAQRAGENGKETFNSVLGPIVGFEIE